MEAIKDIAKKIFKDYDQYDAFIIIAGEDAICTISTFLSFMF
jgi:L-asparaginase/Glu-tRNA(Gln) amidotransferase subunit D